MLTMKAYDIKEKKKRIFMYLKVKMIENASSTIRKEILCSTPKISRQG